MERRKFLIGVGGASLGSSALVGSGAFSAMRAERSVSIDVVEDPNALVGLDSCPGSDNAMYSGINENGQLYIDISEEPNEGDGVNGNSRYWFHNTFQVCNQSGHSICLWVVEHEDWPETSDGNPRVDFYLGDDPDESILGAANAYELGSGECTCVGIYTNTLGLTSADVDKLLEAVDNDISLRANAECPDGEGGSDPKAPECESCDVSESDGTEDFLTIENLDAGNFPEITATARVETTAGENGNLTADDFSICETFGGDNFGQDPSVAFAGEDEEVKADVMIAMDTSGSMSGTKIGNAKSGAKTLVDTLGPGVNIGLVEFSDRSGVSDARVAAQLGTAPGDVKTAIGNLYADGTTPMAQGITKAQEKLNNNGDGNTPNFLVVLANGGADDNDATRQAARDTRNVTDLNDEGDGTTVISIAYGSGADENLMEDLSSPPKTDDDVIDDQDENAFVGETDDIKSVFEDIGEIISGTYSITYTTCNPDLDGSTRDVLVHVDDSDAGVSTATETYTAPSS